MTAEELKASLADARRNLSAGAYQIFEEEQLQKYVAANGGAAAAPSAGAAAAPAASAEAPGRSLAGVAFDSFRAGLPGGLSRLPMGGPQNSPEYAAEVQSRAQRMAEFDAQHPVVGALSAPLAGAAAAADTMTSGYASRALGAVMPGMTAEQGAATVDALREQYPASTFAGDLVGAFKNPIGRAGVAGGGRVAGIIERNIDNLTGGALAKWARESLLVRGSMAATRNVVAGAGGAAAYEATHAGHGIGGDDFGLRQRFASALDAATSPVNLATGVAAGAFGASLVARQSNRARAIAPLVQRFEAITGQKVPVSVYSDNQELHRTMDAMARIPDLADDVAKVRDTMFSGMRKFGEEIAERLTGGASRNPDAASDAAGALRRNMGQVVGGRDVDGAFTTRRQKIQKRFFDRYGKRRVEEGSLASMLDTYRGLVKERTNDIGRNAIDDLFEPLVSRVALISKASGPRAGLTMAGAGETMDTLEALRKQLVLHSKALTGEVRAGDRANLARLTTEAKRMYGAVVEAMNQTVPTHFAKVNRIAEYFHRLEDAFQDVPKHEVDQKLLDGFWNSKNILTAWRGQAERGNPADTSVLRAQYVLDAFENLADANGLISSGKLNQMLRGEGRFNRQVMETVVPGLRDELRGMAKLSEVVRESFPAEGSRTATRIGIGVSQAGRAAQIGSFLVGLLSNPFHGIQAAVGISGIRHILAAYNRSLISGGLGDMMQAATRTGVVPTIGAPGMAATSAGGLAAAQDAGTSVAEQAIGGVGQAAGYVMDAFNEGVRKQTDTTGGGR